MLLYFDGGTVQFLRKSVGKERDLTFKKGLLQKERYFEAI